jgi:quercetin dioxygenase-like cupin family protein
VKEVSVPIHADIAAIPPLESVPGQVWIRRVEGERITLALVELAPGAVVAEHRHPQEQIGVCISGHITIDVEGEAVEHGPGGSWVITSDRPHVATAGPDGAVVVEAFSPLRSDWAFPVLEPSAPPWPPR